MPELPEVETYRKQIEKAVKNKTVIDVHVNPDKLIFAGKSPAVIKKAFNGATVKKCMRKGKYIWFEMSSHPWPVFHLGMTGTYEIADDMPKTKTKSVKLILEFDDGTFMIFRDPRRFGRIFLLDDPTHEKPLANLGPDILNELPSSSEMFGLITRRNSPIKAILLDQSVLAGVGNWVADEVLFQAGIDPHRHGSDLSKAEIKKLHDKISSVAKIAVKAGADDEKYPKTWLFHHRWGKKTAKVSSGLDIEHDTVGGRTTAWVPEIQK
jgi:formamidopyrimidine-DNA glycosylase